MYNNKKILPGIGSKFLRESDLKVFTCISYYDKVSPAIYTIKDDKKGTTYKVRNVKEDIYQTSKSFANVHTFHYMVD